MLFNHSVFNLFRRDEKIKMLLKRMNFSERKKREIKIEVISMIDSTLKTNKQTNRKINF